MAYLIFPKYVNDMMEGVDSYMSLFVDDALLMRRVRNEEDCDLLKKGLETVWEWSREQEIEFNIKKCSFIEFGKSGRKS